MVMASLAHGRPTEYWCKDDYNYWCVTGQVADASFDMDYLGAGSIIDWIRTNHYYYTMIEIHEMEDRQQLMDVMILFSLVIFDHQMNFFRARQTYNYLKEREGITIDTDEKFLRTLIPKKIKYYNHQH